MADHDSIHHGVAPSRWPIVGSIALFFVAVGVVNWLHGAIAGVYVLLFGAFILSYMLYGWFSDVIQENLHHEDMATRASFRWGMFWFILTEFMFFASFFGALFYARLFSLPDLGDATSITHMILWPDFRNLWPLLQTPSPTQYGGPHSVFDPWGIPALNTLVLIASDVTITWAYWAILNYSRKQAVLGIILTMILSIAFILLQVHEFGAAYTEKGITLSSGIYGSTFIMLTGVHGSHVVAGLVMLSVLLFRTLRGDFKPQQSFAIAAVSWYWHFIDVLWLALFIFVYWL